MDYRDQVFISVAENLSFSKAARELFISQPAVTKHIKELENKLSSNLFERKSNKIVLTKSGEVLYKYLIEIRSKYSDLEFALGSLNNKHKGELRIGASSTISQYYIPSIMAAFHNRYPLIKLILTNGNSRQIEQKLENNDIDIALVENHTSDGNFKYLKLSEDDLVLVSSSKGLYSKRKTISLNDFIDTPLVLREKGSGTLEVISNTLNKNGVKIDDLNILVQLGSTESIKNFLHGFDGLAIISRKAVENELASKSLVEIKISKIQFNRDFRIALRFGQNTIGTELFLNFIKQDS